MTEPKDPKSTQAIPRYEPPSEPPEGGEPASQNPGISGETALILRELERYREENKTESKGLREMIVNIADRDAAAHAYTRKHVARVTELTEHLWREVKGSEPPPPPKKGSGEHLAFAFQTPKEASVFRDTPLEGTLAVAAPRQRSSGRLPTLEAKVEEVHDKSSSTDLDVAALKGTVYVVDSKVQKVDDKVAAVDGKVETLTQNVAELTALQREQMGKKNGPDDRGFFSKLGDAVLYAVREREGQKYALAVLGAIGGIVAAIATIVNITHAGRVPEPYWHAPPPAITAPYQHHDVPPLGP